MQTECICIIRSSQGLQSWKHVSVRQHIRRRRRTRCESQAMQRVDLLEVN